MHVGCMLIFNNQRLICMQGLNISYYKMKIILLNIGFIQIAHISYTYLSITFASNSEFVQVCLGFGICDENDRHKINLAIVLFYNIGLN